MLKSSSSPDVSLILKDLGLSPYFFVRMALKELADGDYREAFRLIEYAGTFEGRYYQPDSAINSDFRETISLLRFLVLHLASEFALLGYLDSCDPRDHDSGA